MKQAITVMNRAPTQSITNGDRTDNSDEASSTRGSYSGTRERSRSRERTLEGDRHDHDRSDPREHAGTSHEPTREPVYGVIQTQPRSQRGRKSAPRRHTTGGSAMVARQLEEMDSKVLQTCLYHFVGKYLWSQKNKQFQNFIRSLKIYDLVCEELLCLFS
ncbi:hypothetical protein ACF0H5_018710 [Mactra antiquata]